MLYYAPGITSDDYDPSQDFEVFRKRSEACILAPAKALAESEDTGLAVLALATLLVQPVGFLSAVLLDTKRKNNEQEFVDGFCSICPAVPGSVDPKIEGKKTYKVLRNGLYHEGFIKHGLVIRSQEVPVLVLSGVICVEPKRFLGAVESAFFAICDQIQKDPAARIRFSERMQSSHQRPDLVNLVKVEDLTSASSLSPSASSALTATPPDKATQNSIRVRYDAV